MAVAKTLEDIHKNLSPEPLRTQAELDAFYCSRLNNVRGQDVVERMRLALRRAGGGNHYKAFLMGHSGVGKSTELSRLIREVDDRFRAIRFSAVTELDPGSFQPFDILLVLLADLVERTAKPPEQSGAGKRPPDSLLKDVWDWFATEEVTKNESIRVASELAAGAGVPADSWWAKLLGLFSNLRGEMRYASSRDKEKVEYRLRRLSPLIQVANRLLDECNRLLREQTNREWLFVGEDFDRRGIPPDVIERTFITYSNLFQELRAHLLFTVPVQLVYSEKAVQLPFARDRILVMPDTPVYDRSHNVHREGRAALQEVLSDRLDLELFQRGQLVRLLVASGGNLRILFSLINQAADTATIRQRNKGAAAKIGREDVDFAINQLRAQYLGQLGESEFQHGQNIPYPEKADRLVKIYGGDPAAQVPDGVLYALLRAQAVQEFNGQRWFGVHPIVVDILREQGRIAASKNGKVPGGLE